MGSHGKKEEEEEEEAGSTTFVLEAITSMCTYNVGAETTAGIMTCYIPYHVIPYR
jgi:hypothetical protein